MSWSGTVNCRECYQKGHNRRTCPKLTERIKQYAENENDPEGHYTQKYAKRTGLNLDGTKVSKAKRAANKGTRRCTYCGTRGHNRRTCPILAKNKAGAVGENREFRAKLLEEMKECGLGVGALVKHEWNGSIVMVNHINWHEMTAHKVLGNNSQPVRLCEIGNPRRVSWEYLPKMGDETEQTWGRDRITVVGPVSGSAVAQTMPAGWLDGKSGLDGQFGKDSQSACYWDNRYAS